MSLQPLLAILAIIGFAGLANNAFAQDEFDKPFSTFNLSVKNPNNGPVKIVRVGVKSEVRTGSFNCMAGSHDSGILNILANYVVPFHFAVPETVKDAEPQIEIAGHDSVRLSISVIPSAVGACGPWSANVSTFVVFDNTFQVKSNPILITSADYAEYRPTKLEDAEITTALKHLDSTVRTRAVRALPQSTLDQDAVRLLLRAKLDDRDRDTRIAAASVAATMKVKALARDIARLLSTTRNSEETSAYSWALSLLREPETIDALIATFVNLQIEKPRLPYKTIEYNYSAKDALIKMQHPDVPAKLRPYLTSLNSWRAPGASEAEVKRYTDLCLILSTYRDMQSINQLVGAFTSTQHEIILGYVMRELHASSPGIVRDPFMIGLRAAFEAGLKHENWNHRFLAMSLLIRMQLETGYQERLLRGGLKDKHPSIRTYAAELAAKLGYTALVSDILVLFRTTVDEGEKASYCQAVTSLGKECN